MRVAEHARVPPMVLAVAVGLLIAALTPLVERFAGPVGYVRKSFEPNVPYIVAPALPFFVAVLGLGERWARRTLELLRPYLSTAVDPSRHPPAVGWTGGLLAATMFIPAHEINTSRWSRFVSGDWNLFDVWVVIIVALVLIVSFQATFAMLFVARRVGRLGADLPLDLFNPRRGEPLAHFALRLALLVAIFGVFQGLNALAGNWALGTGVVGAIANFSTCALFLALCTGPFVRSMRALKRAELLRVQAALAGISGAFDQSPLADRLRGLNFVELLAYRREVIAASSWPLDAALWGRWVLYLVLPPLSWVAAAIVEEAVQGALPD